jgi:hypothetical protein
MQRTFSKEVTITAGQTSKDVEFALPSEFKDCIGYGIPGGLATTKQEHANTFSVGLYHSSSSSMIQDVCNANDLIFTPAVPVSDRYKKANFPAGGSLVKISATLPAALGTDHTFTVVFLLANPK